MEPERTEETRNALRAEFEAGRSQRRTSSITWSDYGSKLVSICERCPDADCEDACARAVVLGARITGPKHLQKGMTLDIRRLEKRLAAYFEVELTPKRRR